ncbi:MAG TPA: hypothetical protein VNI52_06320 [Sphingobacteriaceae bacterium]|nr:hypothetical protein [Sphingobacteriaceae bacterium]
MPDLLIALLFFIVLFALELLYFKLAFKYKIIDKPNERSSHSKLTIRGGGIIFPMAVLSWWVFNDFQHPFFVAGLMLASVISFMDDINHLHSKVRFLFQFIAVSLILLQVSLGLPFYWYPLILIIAIGAINAWNFMDGINGITGGYSLITIASLYYINNQLTAFTENSLLLVVMMALLVFNFFNFRRKARCFAGDVGSVSIAFIIIFLMIQAIAATGNFMLIGLILLYGLDAVITIIFRIIRKENIFEAHRSHFYQYLANEKGWPHLGVSVLYAGVQGIINIFIINCYIIYSQNGLNVFPLLILCLTAGMVFLAIRWVIEGKSRLTNRIEVRASE